MSVLKGVALGILSFLLFVLLVVFGFAYTVHQIALSPAFINSVINRVDFAQVAREALNEQQSEGSDIPPELANAIIDSIDRIQPVLKQNINVAVRDTYDYVLGKANAPDLKQTLGETFFTSEFVDSVLQNIDLAQIVDQTLAEETPAGASPSEQALTDSISNTVKTLEPEIKKQVVAASDPIFAYLLGETPTIDLKAVLRSTVLGHDFMTAMINALDIQSITADMVGEELNTQLAEGITLSSSDVDQIVNALEPAVKQGLSGSADALADYLVGIRPGFSATVSLQSALPTVKTVVKQAFLRQLPPDLAGATPEEIDQAFETYWATAQGEFPSSFVIDSSIIGTDAPQAISDMVSSMQDSLREARDSIDQANADMAESLGQVREPVRIAQLAFWGLALLILIIIGGVVLIQRSVRGATRDLGITFTTYGVIFFTGTLIGRMIVGKPDFIERIAGGDMPETALDVVAPIILKLTEPLFVFTLACLLIGIALLVVSFVYPRRQRIVEVTEPADKS